MPKILEFIKAADESCIVDIVPRYDVVGLQRVEFNNKSYICDPAFINYKKSLVSDLYGVLFEMIVYNDLIARGYTVDNARLLSVNSYRSIVPFRAPLH